MRDYKRLVNMGPLSDKDRIILNSVQGQMSDGMWENSPSMERYWKNHGPIEGDNLSLNADAWYQEPRTRWVRRNLEKYIVTKYNPYAGMDDAKVRNFYANKIKQIAKQEKIDYPNEGAFKKGDATNSIYLSRGKGKEVTMGDAYDLYDRLRKYK